MKRKIVGLAVLGAALLLTTDSALGFGRKKSDCGMTAGYGAPCGGYAVSYVDQKVMVNEWVAVPEAYETLLLDAMLGDPTLYARHDFVEESWALITPVHQAWKTSGAREIPGYEAGEWGPGEADAMMAADGRRWRTL